MSAMGDYAIWLEETGRTDSPASRSMYVQRNAPAWTPPRTCAECGSYRPDGRTPYLHREGCSRGGEPQIKRFADEMRSRPSARDTATNFIVLILIPLALTSLVFWSARLAVIALVPYASALYDPPHARPSDPPLAAR